VEQQQFDMRDSVYTICYLDIAGEGVNDVVVMSERGIHILKVSYPLNNHIIYLYPHWNLLILMLKLEGKKCILLSSVIDT